VANELPPCLRCGRPATLLLIDANVVLCVDCYRGATSSPFAVLPSHASNEEAAALLDNAVTPERRDRLFEHIVGCDDCYSTFADAALFLADERERAAAAAPPPPGPLRRGLALLRGGL